MNKRHVGTFYEDAAAIYLEERGIKIIERNYRCRLGEIDLIGIEDNTLVFIEVKYRKNKQYGTAIEAVDYRKQKKIVNVARYYLTYKNIDLYIRFDVVGITDDQIDWIKNAFC